MTDNILFKSFIDKIVTLKDDLFNKKNQIKKKDLILPSKTEKQKIKLYIPEIRISNNNQRDSIKSNQTIQFTIKKKIKPTINLDSSKIIPSVKSVKNILSTNLTTNECEPNNNSPNKESSDINNSSSSIFSFKFRSD